MTDLQQILAEGFDLFHGLVDDHEPILTVLDERSGDGDFGANLKGGVDTAAARAADGDGLARWAALADVFLDDVGGTSGPLFGLLFQQLHAAAAGADTTRAWLRVGAGAGLAAIQRVGEAQIGDRTIVDALAPAVRSLSDGDELAAAVTAAVDGAIGTRDLVARRGRASYVGERAVGLPDPGAVGIALLFVAIGRAAGADTTDAASRLIVSIDAARSDAPRTPAARGTGTSSAELESILAAAAAAADEWAAAGRGKRAAALDAVARALDDSADELIRIAHAETHLLEQRLRGELQRTTFQLRLFGDVLREGGYLDARIDHADPEWPMGAPRPDLRRMLQPIGPVLVFAASNFPFAFSVAGGDTAAALAGGCPVVVKAHSGHPELSRRTGELVSDALVRAGAPAGLFAVITGTDAGRVALQDTRVKAGSFTGSIPGGRALFDLANARPEPIPFYGELGSVNPVFVTRTSDAVRADRIAEDFLASMTLGAGQFCTKPGVLIVPDRSGVLARLRELRLPAAAPLLNERIHGGYATVLGELIADRDVEVVSQGSASLSDPPTPTILRTRIDAVLERRDELFRECFGPTGLVVTYERDEQLLEFARAIDGQLTATVIAEGTEPLLAELVQELAKHAGRLLWNQWPTGVSVTYAQQHGGPYPATTAPGSTSVGTAAIARFLRPVAYQGFPQSLLPSELGDDGGDIPRRLDGRLVVPADDGAGMPG